MNYQPILIRISLQFIRDTAYHFPNDAAQLSIAEQRRIYDLMCRAFAAERPHHLSVVDVRPVWLVSAITVLAVVMRVLFIFTVVALSWVD